MLDPFVEIPPFRVKLLRFASGERYAGLVDGRGMLAHSPNVYGMAHLRATECSATSMDAHMRAVADVLNWGVQRGIDIRARTSSLQMFSATEIVDLQDWLRINRRKTAKNRLGGSRQPVVTVAAGTFSGRCMMARNYLAWCGREALAAIKTNDPKLLEARVRLERFEAAMVANLPFARSNHREGWTEEARALFVEVIRPGDHRNPFQKQHQHRNHALLLLYYETGARRSEVLKLTGEQLNLHGPEPTVHFRRNPDDPRDERVTEPNVKTREHVDAISQELSGALKTWIVKHRSDKNRYPGANRTPYVFVARTGKPLASRTVNNMFALLAKRFPKLGKDVFPHILRNTANDRFSVGADQQGLNEAQEKQARNYKFGWNKNSDQGDGYRERHTRRAAQEVTRRVQEKSVGFNR